MRAKRRNVGESAEGIREELSDGKVSRHDYSRRPLRLRMAKRPAAPSVINPLHTAGGNGMTAVAGAVAPVTRSAVGGSWTTSLSCPREDVAGSVTSAIQPDRSSSALATGSAG